jgi:anti-anti-sigma regulatory factor
MSATSSLQAHIAYESIHDTDPEVLVIDFLSTEFIGSITARELGEQLASMLHPDFTGAYVLDLGNVRSLGSSAFGELSAFARQARRPWICNMRQNLRLGAAMIGLDDHVEYAPNRKAAIDSARRAAIRGQEDTVDYPAFRAESN